MKHHLSGSDILGLLCLMLWCVSPAHAQSPQETRAFVRIIADGTPRQQREASKMKRPSHDALSAEAKRVNENGTPIEKAQFAFVLALFDVDYTSSRDRLLQMSQSVVTYETIPSYLVRLYDQKHDIGFLETLLTMRSDGEGAEELSDEEKRLFSQRPALALCLISSDKKRFNQAAENVAASIAMDAEGLNRAAFEKRKPFPQLHKASRSASHGLRQTYARFVAAAYKQYAASGKPHTAHSRTKTAK